VQGYAYAAWNTGKKLADVFQEAAKAKHYGEKAGTLYKNFNEKFWDKKDGYYVLALDGDKQPCRIKASNMGQLLFTGIVPPERVKKVVSLLMGQKLFSGFGIRTVAQGEANYNPLSYHNGSIWPHDTALIAGGMGGTGHRREAAEVFEGMMVAAKKNDWRLPELFGGFQREKGLDPTAYPRACSPQAWAAAAPFQLLKAVVGLEVDAEKSEVKIDSSHWKPEWGTVRIKSLPVGDKAADIEFSSTGVKVIKADGIKFVTPSPAKKRSRALRPRQD
jgi:glycogen debranching enzyme